MPIEAANSLLPPNLPIIETPDRPVERARLERYIRTMLQRAQQVGIHIIVFGSGTARMCPEGYPRDEALRQIGDLLATWSEWARAYAIQIVLEPLRYEETNTLNTVAESGSFVSQHQESGARLLIDTYHMACNDEAPTDILPWSWLLSHVHVAEKQGRASPGTHGEDLRAYLSMLHKGNYNSCISIECNWKHFTQEVGPALATLREQWATSAAFS